MFNRHQAADCRGCEDDIDTTNPRSTIDELIAGEKK